MPVGGAIDGDYQTTSLSYIDTVNLTTSLTTGNSWVYLLLTRWSDDEPDRNIERAVRETSLVAPLEAKAILTTTAGSRDLSLTSLADRIAI